ncbi:hypothetical protein Acr_00g0017040 [Actinidia rufa]|uniref:Uncharacterized protein n=1 Tax=Actinidia rufa TaxID=165716 RepID=A0A7J0DB19_9ERIC|nr:hypothetical protein Acr_00g0017040 [Actinidia rufa]
MEKASWSLLLAGSLFGVGDDLVIHVGFSSVWRLIGDPNAWLARVPEVSPVWRRVSKAETRDTPYSCWNAFSRFLAPGRKSLKILKKGLCPRFGQKVEAGYSPAGCAVLLDILGRRIVGKLFHFVSQSSIVFCQAVVIAIGQYGFEEVEVIGLDSSKLSPRWVISQMNKISARAPLSTKILGHELAMTGRDHQGTVVGRCKSLQIVVAKVELHLIRSPPWIVCYIARSWSIVATFFLGSCVGDQRHISQVRSMSFLRFLQLMKLADESRLRSPKNLVVPGGLISCLDMVASVIFFLTWFSFYRFRGNSFHARMSLGAWRLHLPTAGRVVLLEVGVGSSEEVALETIFSFDPHLGAAGTWSWVGAACAGAIEDQNCAFPQTAPNCCRVKIWASNNSNICSVSSALGLGRLKGRPAQTNQSKGPGRGAQTHPAWRLDQAMTADLAWIVPCIVGLEGLVEISKYSTRPRARGGQYLWSWRADEHSDGWPLAELSGDDWRSSMDSFYLGQEGSEINNLRRGPPTTAFSYLNFGTLAAVEDSLLPFSLFSKSVPAVKLGRHSFAATQWTHFELPRKICKTASEIPYPHQWATHFQTEVLAPSHLGALLPLTGELRKVHHFASRRVSLSPSLCTHLKRSLPLIKSRERKRLVSATSCLSMYNSSKSTLSPSSGLFYGHPALVALVFSDQTSARVSKHLLALLCHSGSSRCLCACSACLCAPVASLVHSFILYHWTHIPPLAAMLQPIESSIPMEIKFFRSLGTCRTSVNVTDLPSAMRNRTVPLPTTLFVVLFAIRTSPSHVVKPRGKSAIFGLTGQRSTVNVGADRLGRRGSGAARACDTRAARVCRLTHGSAVHVRLGAAGAWGACARLAATCLARAGACWRVLRVAATLLARGGAWEARDGACGAAGTISRRVRARGSTPGRVGARGAVIYTALPTFLSPTTISINRTQIREDELMAELIHASIVDHGRGRERLSLRLFRRLL